VVTKGNSHRHKFTLEPAHPDCAQHYPCCSCTLDKRQTHRRQKQRKIHRRTMDSNTGHNNLLLHTIRNHKLLRRRVRRRLGCHVNLLRGTVNHLVGVSQALFRLRLVPSVGYKRNRGGGGNRDLLYNCLNLVDAAYHVELVHDANTNHEHLKQLFFKALN
jgi:hypothetical protein